MALEKEIARLKELKAFNREYRKIAGFPSIWLLRLCSRRLVKTMFMLQEMGTQIPCLYPHALP